MDYKEMWEHLKEVIDNAEEFAYDEGYKLCLTRTKSFMKRQEEENKEEKYKKWLQDTLGKEYKEGMTTKEMEARLIDMSIKGLI